MTTPQIQTRISTHRFTKVVMKATKVLLSFIPLLTAGVSIVYEQTLRKELVSAAIIPGFANKNISKLTTQTQKILDKDRSVDSYVMDSIVESKVLKAVHKTQGEIAKIN